MDALRGQIVCSDGSVYEGEKIITTIPWAEWEEIAGMPEELWQDLKKLKHSGTQIEYVPEWMDTAAHWIYYPEITALSLNASRILCHSSPYPYFFG